VRILATETVVRHTVEFSDEETDRLQSIGLLPPDCIRPAQASMTADELRQLEALLARTSS
jgi:hypothetical protein